LAQQIFARKGLGFMDKISSPLSRKSLSALLLSGALAGAALAQTPKPATPSPAHAATISATAATVTPESSDKVVLKVGTRSFTKAEMDDLIANLTPQMQRAVASEGKKSLGDQYALVIALSHQAELQHLDQRPDFIHKLQFQKEQLEAQEAFEAISEEAKVTPDDVQQYYTAHSSEYDEITVRQIIVRKKAAEPRPTPPIRRPRQARDSHRKKPR
jgi:peptidyl-prolyl cis-trans isomerase C